VQVWFDRSSRKSGENADLGRGAQLQGAPPALAFRCRPVVRSRLRGFIWLGRAIPDQLIQLAVRFEIGAPCPIGAGGSRRWAIASCASCAFFAWGVLRGPWARKALAILLAITVRMLPIASGAMSTPSVRI